jgi:hypothetical protein
MLDVALPNNPRVRLLSSGRVQLLDFSHDLLDCGALQPAVAVPSVISGARSAKEASETI